MNVDLAKRATSSSTRGTRSLDSQHLHNSPCVARTADASPVITELDEPGDTFEDALGVRELRVIKFVRTTLKNPVPVPVVRLGYRVAAGTESWRGLGYGRR